MSNNVDYFSKKLGFSRKDIAQAIGKSIRTVSAKVSSVNDNITMNRKWKIKMYKNDH